MKINFIPFHWHKLPALPKPVLVIVAGYGILLLILAFRHLFASRKPKKYVAKLGNLTWRRNQFCRGWLTGEENLIEAQSGNQMNDLEYRRKQLLKLQDAVIDLEDLSSGVSIADLTLTDFRIDLAGFMKEHEARLASLPLGTFAATTTNDAAIPPGILFCLRAAGDAARKSIEPGYPLAPHYLVHVSEDGTISLPFNQAKQALDRLRRLCVGRDLPDAGACARFDQQTRQGENMAAPQKLLAAAIASIVGKKEERAVASLFTPGGTHAMKGEFAGINDFEVVAFLVIQPDPATT